MAAGYAREVVHHLVDHGAIVPLVLPANAGSLAPADVVWKSDLETLQNLCAGASKSGSLHAVIAKYLINEEVAENW